MSSTEKPDIRYRITPRARDDLIIIGDYTKSRWGKKQRNHYLKELEKRFAWLAANPLAGKLRKDIAEDYYSFPHGQHVVVYLISDEMIDIIGIPHQEMDILLYFQVTE